MPDAAAEVGLSCARCGTAGCAREHASYFRKRIVDGGSVAERVPVCRIVFCDGRTAALIPTVLWRGRGTVGFVVQAVTLVREVGLEAAWERLRAAGPWSPARSTLGRWCRRARAGLAVAAAVLARPLELSELAGGSLLLDASTGDRSRCPRPGHTASSALPCATDSGPSRSGPATRNGRTPSSARRKVPLAPPGTAPGRAREGDDG